MDFSWLGAIPGGAVGLAIVVGDRILRQWREHRRGLVENARDQEETAVLVKDALTGVIDELRAQAEAATAAASAARREAESARREAADMVAKIRAHLPWDDYVAARLKDLGDTPPVRPPL